MLVGQSTITVLSPPLFSLALQLLPGLQPVLRPGGPGQVRRQRGGLHPGGHQGRGHRQRGGVRGALHRGGGECQVCQRFFFLDDLLFLHFLGSGLPSKWTSKWLFSSFFLVYLSIDFFFPLSLSSPHSCTGARSSTVAAGPSRSRRPRMRPLSSVHAKKKAGQEKT